KGESENGAGSWVDGDGSVVGGVLVNEGLVHASVVDLVVRSGVGHRVAKDGGRTGRGPLPMMEGKGTAVEIEQDDGRLRAEFTSAFEPRPRGQVLQALPIEGVDDLFTVAE